MKSLRNSINGEELLLNRILAHEMKNNLDLIKAGVNDLRIHSSNSTLDLLESASSSLNHLFEVLKCGYFNLTFQNIDLNELILEQLIQIEPLAKDCGINLHFKFHAESIVINGDSFHLGRAVFNILKNAVEACKSNEVITVETSVSPDAANIIIADTGRGMDSETLKYLWKPFFSTKDDKSITHGLGSYIARTAIQKHNGSIRVTSRVNQGTTFHISLPLGFLQSA